VPGTTALRTFDNQGGISFKGVEFELKAGLLDNFQLVMAVSYQENEDDDGVDDVGIVPNFMAKGGILYYSDSGYSLGVFDNYFDKPEPIAGTQEFNPPAESYHWLTFKGTYEINQLVGGDDIPPISANLYIENILDENIYFPEYQFRTINTLPLAGGIAAYASLTLSF